MYNRHLNMQFQTEDKRIQFRGYVIQHVLAKSRTKFKTHKELCPESIEGCKTSYAGTPSAVA